MYRRAAHRLLVLLGLRTPDYKARVRHGEVCMANVELHALVAAVKQLPRPPSSIVEIGSYCGGSTVVIGRAAVRRNAAGKVYAIDPFSFDESRYNYNYEASFDSNVAEWDLRGTVVKVKKTSDEVAAYWDRQIDFLFVDGDHSYEAVANDIRNFVPFVRRGSLFALHDYKPVGKEGVKQAVEELIMPHHELLFTVGSLICFRKCES